MDNIQQRNEVFLSNRQEPTDQMIRFGQIGMGAGE